MSEAQAKELERRLTSLEKDIDIYGDKLAAHDKSFERIEGKIEDIIKILSSRPTWLVTGLITILTTVTSSLIVYVSTHH